MHFRKSYNDKAEKAPRKQRRGIGGKRIRPVWDDRCEAREAGQRRSIWCAVVTLTYWEKRQLQSETRVSRGVESRAVDGRRLTVDPRPEPGNRICPSSRKPVSPLRAHKRPPLFKEYHRFAKRTLKPSMTHSPCRGSASHPAGTVEPDARSSRSRASVDSDDRCTPFSSSSRSSSTREGLYR
jgi:hypothetical protein